MNPYVLGGITAVVVVVGVFRYAMRKNAEPEPERKGPPPAPASFLEKYK